MRALPILIGVCLVLTLHGVGIATRRQPLGASGAAVPAGANLIIDAAGTPTLFDPTRLLGANTAVWLHPAGLASPTLLARTRALGSGLLRIPGGAWSQEYGGLSCEFGVNLAGASPCKRFYEARPSNLIGFLKATGRQALYTVNINTTANEAAALVAFFNAQVDDATVIGRDSHGADWKTAGYWASLRAQHGHPQPFPIAYWDFGNETYGGVAGSGPKCPAEGWEAVWTCDGTEYINGARGHDGYRQFRAAMRAVDPTIQLGAVGYDRPEGYRNWTNDVLVAGGDIIDFLTIHPYPYYFFPPNTPAGHAEILALPQTQWSANATAVRAAIQTHAPGRAIPIWVTEFNLGNPAGDNDHLMSKAINALYIADSIGQIIIQGYAVGQQWDLVGYNQSNGANMGLMNADASLARLPSYYAYPLWNRAGDRLLPVQNTLDAARELSVYAGRVDGRTVSLLAINKTGQAIERTIAIQGAGGVLTVTGGTADVVRATSLVDASVTFNGVASPADDLSDAPAHALADDLSDAPAQALAEAGTAITYEFPAYSIVLLRLTTEPSGPGGLGGAAP